MGTDKPESLEIYNEALEELYQAYKYKKADSYIVAYTIPRVLINPEFDKNKKYLSEELKKELHRPYIYFLRGREEISHGKVYVGKSGKLDYTFKRLVQHDNKEDEYYYDCWDEAIVFISHDDAKPWEGDLLEWLEYTLWKLLPEHRKFNKIKPPVSNTVTTRDVDSRVKIIKAFLSHLKVKAYDVEETDTVKKKATEDISYTNMMFRETQQVERINKEWWQIPEIITPNEIVEEMVKALPEEMFQPDKTFIDLACKGGEYLKAIFNRLMKSKAMIKAFSDENVRKNYINEHLYGLAISSESASRTRRNLYGTSQIRGNIRVIPNYMEVIRGYKLIANRNGKGYKREPIETDLSRELEKVYGEAMKFNVVIGNPPYQDPTGSGQNKSGGTALFNYFISQGIDISDQIVCMITPTKWMSANQKDIVQLRRKFLDGNHISKMVDYFNPTHVFPGTQIAGGVSYFVYDKNYSGETEFIHKMMVGSKENPVCADDEGNRSFNKEGIIPRHSVGEKVVNKIKLTDNEMLDTYIGKDIWKLPTNFTNGSIVETPDCPVKVFTPKGELYVSKESIPNEYVDTYKVLFTRAVTGSTFYIDTSKSILSSIKVLKPNEICNASYMVVYGIKTYEYAENIKEYLKTKFVRFLLLQTLFGIGLTADRFQFIPLQDFTHPWTDQMLYEKYKLTPEEIDYIEKTIEPMDDTAPNSKKSTIDLTQAMVANYVNNQLN